MPFPITPREVYRKNPLDEVVCQFDFPPILEITSTSPVSFQNAIRDDYPWYDQQFLGLPEPPTDIRDFMGSLPGFPFAEAVVHQFSMEDRLKSIMLRQSSVSVIDRDYRDWTTFKPLVERCELVLRDCYAPSFYTRVGLRYRDVIDKTQYGIENTPWSDLLNPSFLGVLGDPNLAGDALQSQARVVLKIPDVEEGIVIIQHGLPNDGGEGLNIYLLDADFYTERRCTTDDAFIAADKFNQWGGHLFRWAATKKLRDLLGPTSGESA